MRNVTPCARLTSWIASTVRSLIPGWTPGERLVQQAQDERPLGEAARELEEHRLPSRECPRLRVGQPVEPDKPQERFGLPPPVAPPTPPMIRAEDDEEVLPHGHVAKHTRQLERARDPARRDRVRRLALEGASREHDLAAVRSRLAADEVKERRLPRPVGPDQRADLAAGERGADVPHRRDPAEGFVQAVEDQQRVGHAGVFAAGARTPSPRNPIRRCEY